MSLAADSELAQLRARLAALEAENAQLRARVDSGSVAGGSGGFSGGLRGSSDGLRGSDGSAEQNGPHHPAAAASDARAHSAVSAAAAVGAALQAERLDRATVGRFRSTCI